MAVAVGGTLWFCKTVFLVAGEMTEGVKILPALGIHAGTLLASAIVVVGSWISGVRYGRATLRNR